jgi:hypothetical protein
VLRLDPRSRKFVDVVLANPAASPASGCAGNLHRPEGLVFGPDGKLYVTSFRADANDTDRILIVDVKKHTCVNQILLDQVGQDGAYAQAVLFGPGGDLFVPITDQLRVRC